MPDPAFEDPIEGWLSEHAQGAARLARCVSLAACVEPELLRGARLELCPDLGVEAEAAIWFSPLVESRSTTGAIFSAHALGKLWKDFPERPRLDEIRQITRFYRAGVPAAVQLEEELAYWSLSERPDATQEIDRALARILATLLRPERRHLALWAERAFPRLQQTLQGSERLSLLQQAARERGAVLPSASAPVPEWLKDRPPVRFVSVSLVEGGLLIRDPPHTSDLLIEVPQGQPVLLLISNSGDFTHAEQVLLNGPLTHWKTTWQPPFHIQVAGADAWVIDRVDVNKPPTFVQLYGPGAPEVLLNDIAHALISAGLPVFQQDTTTANVLVYVVGAFSTSTWLDTTYLEFRLQCRHIVIVSDGSVSGSQQPDLPTLYFSAPTPPDLSVATSLRWGFRFEQLIEAVEASSDLPARIDSVPALPRAYIERPALQRGLRDALQAGTVIRLKGEDGMGRRTLAIAAARECWCRRRFSGGIFWLSNPPDAINPGSKRLFICDYPDATTEWLPEAETGSAALLTRDTAMDFPTAITFEVTAMDEQTATALWNKTYQDPRSDLIRGAAPNYRLAQETINPLETTLVVALSHRYDLTDRISQLLDDPTRRPQRLNVIYRWVRELEQPLLAEGGLQALAFVPEIPVPRSLWEKVLGSGALDLIARLADLSLIARNPDDSIVVRRSASEALLPLTGETGHYHSRILSVYESECQSDWPRALRQFSHDTYIRNAVLYHLWNSGRQQEASAVDVDYDWIRNTTFGKQPQQLRYLARWSLTPRTTSMWSRIADGMAIGTPIENLLLDPQLEGDGLFPPGRGGGDIGKDSFRRLRQRATARLSMRNGQARASVLVVGLGGPKIPNEVVYASEALGRELARAGFALLSGGWPGVDHMVCREYVRELRLLEIPSVQLLTHVIPANTTPDLWSMQDMRGEGGLDASGSPDQSMPRSVERSDFVVIVGGVGGTYEIAQLAEKFNRPAFPIPGTGGVADKLAEQDSAVRPLDGYPSAWRAIREVVARMENYPAQNGELDRYRRSTAGKP